MSDHRDGRALVVMDLAHDPLAGTAYRTIAPMGSGGMGEILLAEHVALGKRVAVKVLHTHLSRDPTLLDRLRLEAHSLARLARHPSLVQVLDLGRTSDGRPFLVLERLRGRTLQQELAARGPLPPLEAIDRIRQALTGLSAAHTTGIVHRDVKLDNLFLCDPRPGEPRATVKVLDFGVAKLLDTAAAIAPLAHPTEAGMVVGSPRALSPEQARGAPVDQRTDVYGAGMALYRLLAGRGPYDHVRGIAALIHAQVTQDAPPPSTLRLQARAQTWQEIPASLDAAVLKAVARDPSHRFASADTMSDALARVAQAIEEDDEADAAPTVMFASLPPARAAAPRTRALEVDARPTVRLTDLSELLLPPPLPPAPSPPDAPAPITSRESPWSKKAATCARWPGAETIGLRMVLAGGLALVLATLAVILAYHVAGGS